LSDLSLIATAVPAPRSITVEAKAIIFNIISSNFAATIISMGDRLATVMTQPQNSQVVPRRTKAAGT
jgi:hypothetical protein